MYEYSLTLYMYSIYMLYYAIYNSFVHILYVLLFGSSKEIPLKMYIRKLVHTIKVY